MDEKDTPLEPVREVRFIGTSVPVALADALATRASENDRSAAAELRQAVRLHLAKSESEAA